MKSYNYETYIPAVGNIITCTNINQNKESGTVVSIFKENANKNE